MKIREIVTSHLTKFLAEILQTFRDRSSGKGCKSCSYRKMFQNEYYRRRYSLERFSKRLEIFLFYQLLTDLPDRWSPASRVSGRRNERIQV